MAIFKFPTTFPIVLLGLAALYQYLIRDLVFNTVGLGRHPQPISDFPYKCRRIENDPAIQACEDMWLDESSRQLFLACSDPLSRKYWMPNIHRLNVSGRALNDHIVAMDIDDPTPSGSFSYRVLTTPDFSGVNGDGRLHLVGMTGSTSKDGSTIQLWLVNAKPSLDGLTGEIADNEITGSNSTIEVFETGPQAATMKHVRTFADSQIATPNNVALTGDGGFYFTNDHGPHKVGWGHHLSPLLGTGDVSYCPAHGPCKRVATGFRFPNGLHLSRRDGLLYVPSAFVGGITVFEPQLDGSGSVRKVHFIPLNYPIDNLSEDAEGDIYAATMPKVLDGLGAFDDPFNAPTPAAAVHRVRRIKGGKEYEYQIVKVVEDAKGEVLPGTTTVIHDAKKGRLFLSGVIAPFITVCEKS